MQLCMLLDQPERLSPTSPVLQPASTWHTREQPQDHIAAALCAAFSSQHHRITLNDVTNYTVL